MTNASGSSESLLSEEPSKDIWQQMAEFIVNTEFAAKASISRDQLFLQRLQEKEHQLDQKLQELMLEIRHFRKIMSRSGAKQWRDETEKLLSLGKNELQAMEEIYGQVKTMVKEHCERLNRTSMNTVKTVAQMVSEMRRDDLQKLAEQNTVELQSVSNQNLNQVTNVIQWFHWKNLILSVLLTFLVSFIMSLYIQDEWPWETHAQVAKEREAGQALMNTWPQLSHNDQTIIENA